MWMKSRLNGCTVKGRKQMWKLKIRFWQACSRVQLCSQPCDCVSTTSLIIHLHTAKTAEHRSCPHDQLTVYTHLSMRDPRYGLLGLTTNDNGRPGPSVSWAGSPCGIQWRAVVKTSWEMTKKVKESFSAAVQSWDKFRHSERYKLRYNTISLYTQIRLGSYYDG